MSFSQETLYAIALTRISYFNTATCLQLYRKLGSAITSRTLSATLLHALLMR